MEIGLAKDFHVAIFFEKLKRNFQHDEILSKVQERLKKMDMPLEKKIVKLISILCKNKTNIWARIIKLHLENLKRDTIGLLRGTRPFILELENDKSYLGKVAKGYDNCDRNNLLSLKINNEILKGMTAHHLFRKALTNSFNCGHSYEITSAQKNHVNIFAWIVALSPNETKKIAT